MVNAALDLISLCSPDSSPERTRRFVISVSIFAQLLARWHESGVPYSICEEMHISEDTSRPPPFSRPSRPWVPVAPASPSLAVFLASGLHWSRPAVKMAVAARNGRLASRWLATVEARQRRNGPNRICAGVAKSVNAADLKSCRRRPALYHNAQTYICTSGRYVVSPHRSQPLLTDSVSKMLATAESLSISVCARKPTSIRTLASGSRLDKSTPASSRRPDR